MQSKTVISNDYHDYDMSPLSIIVVSICGNFKWSKAGSNSVFFFPQFGFLIKAKEVQLTYYLLNAGGRIDGFMPFTLALAQSEIQRASSTIWTWVTTFIFKDA